MNEETGRNDPCICGSGKKYKKCCLLTAATERPLSRTLHQEAAQTAVRELLEFCGEFGIKPTLSEDLPEPKLNDSRQAVQFFHLFVLPWLLYQNHPRDPETLNGPSEETIAAKRLRQRGASLDGMTRRFMEAARAEPFSFWQVMAPSPGSGLLLKDMITGEERFVADVSMSQSTARWDILFAHVVGLDGLYIFSAAGLYPLKPAQSGEAIARYAKLLLRKDDALPDRAFLFKFQHRFLRHYMESVEDMFNAPPPEIRNMDGDKQVIATSIHVFDPTRRADV